MEANGGGVPILQGGDGNLASDRPKNSAGRALHGLHLE
jgi:hypothetical protein